MGVSQSLWVDLVSQNIGSNSSVIRINWTSTQDGASQNTTGSASAKYYVYVNDELILEHWPNFLLHKNTTDTIANDTVVVYHDDRGEATVRVETWMDTRISAGVVEDDWEDELPSIPRASTLVVSSGTLGQEMTINFDRKATSLRHRLTFVCGDFSGYIAGSRTEYYSGASVAWTPQIAYSRTNTEGDKVSITLTLYTYSLEGIHVGTDTKTISCAIPDSVKPSCAMATDDATGFDVVYGSPVQGLSKMKVTVVGTESYDSPITKYEVVVGGVGYVGSEITTQEIRSSGSVNITATVTDKRGRRGSISKTINVLPYQAPSVSSIHVMRCDADGVENAQGKFVKVTFSASVTSLGDKNSAQYALKYRVAGSEDEYITVQLPALNGMYSVKDFGYLFEADNNSSFEVAITASDNHGSSTRSTAASTAFSFMDWHHSGTGLAFGKLAEKEHTMEIALSAEFLGSQVQIGNKYSAFIPEGNDNAYMDGYDLMARIAITNTHANCPFTFTFTRRGATMPMTVHFRLVNEDTLDPSLSYHDIEGADYGAYLHHSGPSIWDLYVARSDVYDFITLQSWHMAQYMEGRAEVTFPGRFSSSLPDGAHRITRKVPTWMQSMILDLAHPVNSIYIAYSHENPADLFGGTWTRISNAFLWGIDSSGTIGTTGGSKTHTLTIDEMPAHSHDGVRRANNYRSGESSTGQSSGSDDSALETNVTGGGQPHNNMPPYVSVSIWRRTA